MDEKNTEEKKQEETTVNDDEGVQSKTTTELDRADQIAERLKRENDRKEGLLTREENLAARKAVGGEAEAGTETKKLSQDDKDEIEAKKFLQEDE